MAIDQGITPLLTITDADGTSWGLGIDQGCIVPLKRFPSLSQWLPVHHIPTKLAGFIEEFAGQHFALLAPIGWHMDGGGAKVAEQRLEPGHVTGISEASVQHAFSKPKYDDPLSQANLVQTAENIEKMADSCGQVLHSEPPADAKQAELAAGYGSFAEDVKAAFGRVQALLVAKGETRQPTPGEVEYELIATAESKFQYALAHARATSGVEAAIESKSRCGLGYDMATGRIVEIAIEKPAAGNAVVTSSPAGVQVQVTGVGMTAASGKE